MASILPKQDLVIQRQHLIANIQLADQKATGLVAAYQPLLDKKDIPEFMKLYNKVMFPVTMADYEMFSLTNLDAAYLYEECESLREIVMQKYKNISDMIKYVNTKLGYGKGTGELEGLSVRRTRGRS